MAEKTETESLRDENLILFIKEEGRTNLIYSDQMKTRSAQCILDHLRHFKMFLVRVALEYVNDYMMIT